MRRVIRILLPVLLSLLVVWGWLALSPAPPLLDGVAFSPLVLDREGNLLRLGLTEDDKYRVRVRLHEIAPEAVRAVLLYEDRHFYRHPGVNPLALLRAGVSMLGGSRRMGGSTITMQVARLRLGLSTNTLAGKFRQMCLALQYEYHYDKDAILEAYFNLAPYGGNIEGIGAAARIYFHTTPGRLSRSESLALAAVPQNPVRRSPLHGPDFAEARSRMQRLADMEDARQTPGGAVHLPVAPLTPLRVYGPADLPFDAPHASSELLALSQKGMPVRACLDPGAQRTVERAIEQFAARGRRYGLNNAAALLVHWPDMEVRALVGSAGFHRVDISGQVDGTRARRSPGSTLKPFVYALALEQGLIHPQTVLPDSPRHFGAYQPENFDRAFRGPIPAHVALRASRNLPAIRLASQLRPDLYAFLIRAGVQLPFDQEHYGLSLVLGGAEMSMRELAALYSMLANKGVLRQLRFYKDQPRAAGQALLSPEAAIVTLRMLEDEAYTVRTRRGVIPLRAKTGTSNGFRDAWTAGVIGPYVLVVWTGNFDNTPNPLLVGGEVAAPLFRDIAQALAVQEDLDDRIPAQQEGLNITRERVCTATGDLDTSLCADTTETWYIPGRSPTRPSGVFRTILVNRETGLRACEPVPGQTEERVWEFWPSDLAALFAQAGVIKPPPPPFEEACRQQTPPGRPPFIITPREGVIYQRRLSEPDRNGIPLKAGLEADARAVFWFVKDTFIGKSEPGKAIMWYPPGGRHELRAVDDLGRVAMQRVVVRVEP
ncbi:MAG TPA: penicillin-binding protein 1C [Candidatus Avidesulfovibrio excrementigallinarum]|nr:penicillin-binding protein 1C [Candidatus Avidesulfovibrio excrementigallinarum]